MSIRPGGLTAAAANAAYEPSLTTGLLGARPAAATFGKGYYFATDDNGGSLYHSDGTGWTKVTVGVNWASGTQLAYSQDTALSFDAKASGTAWNDISTLLKVTVPASSVPVKVEGKVFGYSLTGTAVAGGTVGLQLQLTDSANTQLDLDALTSVQVTATNVSWFKSFSVSAVLPAPVAGGTYKLRGRVQAAAPANWGNVFLLSTPDGGLYPKAWIQAVAE